MPAKRGPGRPRKTPPPDEKFRNVSSIQDLQCLISDAMYHARQGQLNAAAAGALATLSKEMRQIIRTLESQSGADGADLPDKTDDELEAEIIALAESAKKASGE